MIQIIFEYWIELLLTSLTTGIIYIFKQYVGLKNGVKAILRNEIVRIYENYSKWGASWRKQLISLIIKKMLIIKE